MHEAGPGETLTLTALDVSLATDQVYRNPLAGPLSSAGSDDIYAVKLDAQGQHLWSRRLGGTSADVGYDIAVDSAGNGLLTGYFTSTADFGGGPLSRAGYSDIFTLKLSH